MLQNALLIFQTRLPVCNTGYWSVVQVLVLFHVLHSSAWYSPAHLLPFSQRMHEKAGEGRAALGSQRTVKLSSFERAVKVLNT